MHSWKHILCLLLTVLMLTGAVLALPAEPSAYTVACVGDSLTYGTGCRNRGRESWPAVLARMEGPLALSTLNFGSYGRTVTDSSFLSYTSTHSYRQSMNAGADVYLVMLGSNDLLLRHWERNLAEDFRALLTGYMELEQEPEVIVLLPPDLYYKNFLSFTNRQIDELRAVELAVAEELGLEVIDLSVISGDMSSYCIDGGHYNAQGYALFADYIYDGLCGILGRRPFARVL